MPTRKPHLETLDSPLFSTNSGHFWILHSDNLSCIAFVHLFCFSPLGSEAGLYTL